jgi:uncharacterized protein YutD
MITGTTMPQTTTQKQFNQAIQEILRNIDLNQGDMGEDGCLTDQFYDRDDISAEKKKILKNLTTMLKG